MKIKFFESIQTKLLVTFFLMMAFVLLLLSCVYVYKDYVNYTNEVNQELSRTAKLVGDSSLASLLFDDPDSAQEILNLLNSQKHMLSAQLYDSNKRLFANYVRNNGKNEKVIPHLNKVIVNLNRPLFKDLGDHAYYIKHIHYEKKIAGTMVMVYEMDERRAKILQSIVLVLIASFISIFLVFLTSYFLQRSIFRPLAALAQIMQDITISKKFNGNMIESDKQDEVAWLIKGFNEMLGQIQRQDERLKSKNKELKHIAYHDPLTDLPNFLLFKEVVQHAISNRSINTFSILFIDLDNFKNVNDTFGHGVGDKYLKAISVAFNQLLRTGDYTSFNDKTLNDPSNGSVARLGGDEFIIMLEDTGDGFSIEKVIQRFFSYFESPLTIEGIELYVKLSIGIAIYPDDATDMEKLIKYADTAMYQVKGSGKNHYGYFNKSHHLEVKRKLLLEQSMVRGIEKNQFKLYFQPKINIINDTIDGFEVLLRWEHPELGPISPVEFIPIAEMSRFILILGEWVIAESCKQLSAWRREMSIQFTLAINLSPLQFKSDSLFNTIEQSLLANQLPPGSIELEITEGILMDDHELSFDVIDELSQLGVKFSIDDFGTGYSSFQYLSRFNAQTIKIDKMFIDDIDTFVENQVITKAIISLAHNMGMKIVAEGVETFEQLAYLKNTECDIIQGYYFSKPLPANELADFFLPYLKK